MILIIWLLAVPLWAEAAPGAALFQSDGILDLTLEYDIDGLRKDRGDSRSYHPARLSYRENEGKTVSMTVRISARGRLRRLFLKCTVPPIKIKFAKEQVRGTIFAGQKTLKVVTHCKNKPSSFQHYYLTEYLIYKMYNILTDMSFRVRLARITYARSGERDHSFTGYGFFIERYKDMAKRNQARTTKVETIPLPVVDFETSTLVSVFQYLIGNTDWSIRSIHNTRLIFKEDGAPKYYPVPFDFDSSGLIDAHYVRPDENLPIKSVRERLYRGYCKSRAQFKRTFMIFHRHKAEIIALFRDFPLLPEKIKQRHLKYIEGFYEIIAKPKLVKRYFIDNYRGRPFPKR